MNHSLYKKSLESIVFMSIAMALSMGISAVGRFVLAAQLDSRIFGNFTVVAAILGFVTIFVNTMGDRFIVVTTRDRERTINTIFTTEISIWLIVCALWLALSPLFWKDMGGGMSWTLASLLLLQGLSFPLGRPRALLERELNFKTISIVNTLTNALSVGLAILLAISIKSELPLIVNMLLSILQSVYFIKVGNVRIRFSIDWEIFGEYMRLCLPLMVSGLLVFFYWNIDRVLLDRYVERQEIGYYGWAFSLGIMVLRLKDIVASVLFPVFAEIVRSGKQEQIKKGLDKIYRSLIFFIGAVVPILIFAAPYFVRFAGVQWIAATSCVQLAILIFAVRSLNGFLEPVFIAHSRSHLLMYIALFNAFFVFVGGWLSLKFMPKIEAMAIVVLISCLGTFLICAKAIYEVCEVDLLKVLFPGISMALLSYLVMCIWIWLFGEHILMIGFAIMAGLISYFLFMWREGFQLAKEIIYRLYS